MDYLESLELLNIPVQLNLHYGYMGLWVGGRSLVGHTRFT